MPLGWKCAAGVGSVARTVASFSRPVLKLLKRAVLRSQSMALDDGLVFERKPFQLTFGLHDRREGMEAFVEKRETHPAPAAAARKQSTAASG